MKNIYSGIIKVATASVLVVALTSCGGAEDRKIKYLEKGKAYLAEKNYEKAKIEIKNVLQIDPKYAEAYYLMGRLNDKERAFGKAISNYKKALELNPDHVEAKVKLAVIYVIAGTEDYISKAKKLLGEVKVLDPNNSEAAFVAGTILYKTGKEKEAISQMSSVLKSDRHLIGGISLLSNIYIAKSRESEAVELLKKGVNDNPNESYLLISLAKIQAKNGDLDSAEKNLKKAIEIEPEKFSLKVVLSKFYASTDQLDKAQSILRQGIEQEPDDAERYLILAQLLAVRVSPESAENELLSAIKNKPDLFELKFALVKLYRQFGKNEEVKEILNNIIEEKIFDVNGVKARNQLAEIAMEEGNITQAITYLDEVLAEYPNENDSIFMSSKIALSKNDAITAINGLRTVVKKNPKNANASLLLAQAYEMNNETLLAETELKRAIEINPVEDDVHINYARYLASKGRVDEAMVVVDRALAYFKDSFGLMELKLKVVASQGNESEVLALLDRMEQADETKADVNLTRGQYYLSKKDIKNALEQFEKAYLKSRNKYKTLELIVKAHLFNKNPEKALLRLKTLYANKAESGIAHHLSAKIYLSQKKLVEARDQFKLASQASEKWVHPYLSLAQTYIAENDYKQAENIYHDAINNVTDKTLVYMQLASLYERQKSYDKAMSSYQQVLDIKPDDMIAKNNYASLLLDHGTDDDLAKALKLLEGFEKIQQPAFQDTLAWAYAKSADYVKAVELLKPLVEKTPEIAVFRYHLGYALYHMGDKAAAKSHLTIAESSEQQFIGKEQAKILLKSMQ